MQAIREELGTNKALKASGSRYIAIFPKIRHSRAGGKPTLFLKSKLDFRLRGNDGLEGGVIQFIYLCPSKKTARRSEPFCVKYSLRLEAEYSYEVSRE